MWCGYVPVFGGNPGDRANYDSMECIEFSAGEN